MSVPPQGKEVILDAFQGEFGPIRISLRRVTSECVFRSSTKAFYPAVESKAATGYVSAARAPQNTTTASLSLGDLRGPI
jgi:hypothetical protein